MADVVKFPGETLADETVAEFLSKVETWRCEDVVVVGIDGNGDLHVGSNTSKVQRTLAMLQLAGIYLSNLLLDEIKINPSIDS